MEYTEKILIVDDDKALLDSLELNLISYGFKNVTACDKSNTVMEFLESTMVDVITLDITMPEVNGEVLLEQIKQKYPTITVIIISGIMDVETVINCMRHGAMDYLMKPVDGKRLSTTLANAVRNIQLRAENQTLRNACMNEIDHASGAFNHIITQSKRMFRLFSYTEAIAKSSFPILITGDTGTGKELLAKAIHLVRGEDSPYITCNVAGIDDVAFSDTLFGHTKGAFTGADTERSGLLERAQGGTIFLDEIGELSQESQVKLLRLIQEGEYLPLGSDVPKKSNAHILVATNRDLGSDPSFRKDLYFRLNAHELKIPTLSERQDDIPLLISYFADKHVEITGQVTEMQLRGIERNIAEKPLTGNIRELEGLVVNTLMAGDYGDAPINASDADSEGEGNDAFVLTFNGVPTMNEIKLKSIEKVVEISNGNKTHAARLLGISKQSILNLTKVSDS